MGISYFIGIAFAFGQDQETTVSKSLIPMYNNKQVYASNIAQDSLGNVWMSSYDGMLIYNGYSYSLIDKKSVFPKIKKGDRIASIVNDRVKNIWINTAYGLLSKYDTKNGQFEHYGNKLAGKSILRVLPKTKEVLLATKEGVIYKYHNQTFDSLTTIPGVNTTDNMVNSLEFDQNSTVYVGTTMGKIYKYSEKSGRQSEIIGPFTDYPGIINLRIDNKNRLWIGTEANGLFLYSLETQRIFSAANFLKGDIEDIASSLITNLFLDSNGNIWTGTDGNGLFRINTKTGRVKAYKKRHFDGSSIGSNTILDISEDAHKNIWLVTKNGALNVLPNKNKDLKYHPGSKNGIPTRVLSILKGKDKALWIGTDGNGLTKVRSDGATEQFFNGPKKSFYVQCIIEDQKTNLWLGTYKSGLWRHNKVLETFTPFKVENNLGQIAKDIRALFKDSRDRIWVGSNVSLNIYDPKGNLLATFGNNENGLNGIIVESLAEDGSGNIWVGQQNGGLFKFIENELNIGHSTFENFKVNSDETKPKAVSISPNTNNQIWFISEHNQLTIYNTKTEKFENFSHIEKINTLQFRSIISVDRNNVWASTHSALAHIDTKHGTVDLFYTSDGLPNGNFMVNSKFKDEYGQLYFGHSKGITYFMPEKLTKRPSNPKLIIHGIEVLNKPAKDLLPNQITSEVFNVTDLDLTYNQSSFSVKFSAIDNILNPNFSYSYQLSGFDQDWKTTYSEGLATYTNVPPGQYTLKIKGHDMNDLSKSFGKDIHITIDQPFWNKTPAHLTYIVLLLMLGFGIFKWYHLRKKLLVNKIIRLKEQDLHKTKMDFFTKMSHEIQTPITLILGPIDDMLKRAEQNGNMLLKQRLNIISNNANRLSRIARELTLIRNKESNNLRLYISRNNLYQDVNKICLSFKEIARSKQVDFSISCPKNLNNAWYDREKVEHIVYNLLSNAFKFTPQEGNVQLSITPDSKKSFIKIAVSDSGPGIKKNELDKIFKIFYRSQTSKNKGTGIGLALTKELVTLHKGKIKVSSTENEGTTFTVKIPITEQSYQDEEKIALQSQESQPEIKDEVIPVRASEENPNRKNILVVEDNFELQQFLKDLLYPQHNILLADNGEEGFYLAKNNIPDLIISDIMMPEMDGIMMCKELNKLNLTKHIPIILLTAKNSTKAKIEGLKTGAIEYINKPFNANELLLKVNNILLSKEHIISKYRKELINRPQVLQNQSQEEIFLETLVETINKNIGHSSFKVDQLAESLNMSYSSLYRKCMSIIGMNLVDFIREMRLKKGAVLLVKYGYSISEVAHLVGFNDPKYFSKSFKNKFGKTPKEFKSRAEKYENVDDYLAQHQITDMMFKMKSGA